MYIKPQILYVGTFRSKKGMLIRSSKNKTAFTIKLLASWKLDMNPLFHFNMSSLNYWCYCRNCVSAKRFSKTVKQPAWAANINNIFNRVLFILKHYTQLFLSPRSLAMNISQSPDLLTAENDWFAVSDTVSLVRLCRHAAMSSCFMYCCVEKAYIFIFFHVAANQLHKPACITLSTFPVHFSGHLRLMERYFADLSLGASPVFQLAKTKPSVHIMID